MLHQRLRAAGHDEVSRESLPFEVSGTDEISYNTDVYLGWIGWSAGAFDGSYELAMTPQYSGGRWTDTGIVANCIAGMFNK
jgi:hypothetical protein